MKRSRKEKNLGFTLIELLVTITIVGVLSGLLLSVINVKGLRQKSRDSARRADLEKIRVALESYLADHRFYPSSTGESWMNLTVTGNDLENALVHDYLDKLPRDPALGDPPATNSSPCASADKFRYNYASDGTRYILTTIMEVASSNDDSPCHELFNWGYTPPLGAPAWTCSGGGSYETADVCYGVQNP